MSAAGQGFDWRSGVRIASLLLLLAGGVHYVWQRVPRIEPTPLSRLEVASDADPVSALPVAPGSLAGRDVLLVTLDTTRPDRLGVYGNDAVATPTLDRLGREGVVFSRAVATGPTTLPTHASILTGLYPQRHGARANSHYALGEEHETLAESLSRAGYATGAFVSAFVLDDRFGLGQGFDVYDDAVENSSGGLGYAERKADRTTEAASRWLRRQAGPSFTWVHYYDPHQRHEPPAEFRDRHDWLYDAEIAFVDRELGRLLDAIPEARRDRTLVVVVGDHGEAFGEHGEWSHGFLLQEATLQIPLILHAPGGLPGGLHFDGRVSQVDLVPTLLSLLGLPVPLGLDGADLVAGAGDDRAVLAEALEGRSQYGWGRLAAIYSGAFKYIHGEIAELYDLEQDPLERRDLSAERADEVASLRRRLEAREGPEADQLAEATVALSDADAQRLEALGYAAGGGAARSARSGGDDPRVVLPLLVEVQALVDAYTRYPELTEIGKRYLQLTGRPVIATRAQLVSALEDFAEAHPRFAPAHQYLAIFYARENREADSQRAEARWQELIR